MRRQPKIILLIILIFCGLILFRILFFRSTPEIQPQAGRGQERVVVKAESVGREDLKLVLSYVGSIKAEDEINVYSKVTGKLYEYTVNEGDRVEKGQTIAFIDRDQTGLKFELARVESPIAGVVGRTFFDKGANISISTAQVIFTEGTPLAVIVNMDEMMVRLNVPEPDIPYLKRGLEAEIEVDAYPNEKFSGKVSKVAEVIDTQTRTLPIEIRIPNSDHRLKSGMFARIKIIAAELKERLVIPQDALTQEFGVNFVFVVENSTAKKKKVTVGIKEDTKVEVLEGLVEGEKVIVFGQQGLKDGMSVEVVK